MAFDPHPFHDRHDAGRQLAAALMHLKDDHPVVLALPRGGVPVAYEVARALDAPLDVLLVRKIGAPGQPELGLGAVIDGAFPQRILNDELVRLVNPPEGYIDAETDRQIQEIERRRTLYCGAREPVRLEGRTVIVVDDGIATGGTLKTALSALSKRGVRRLIFAVPVAPEHILDEMRREAGLDAGICLLAPRSFRAVSLYYTEFDQTSDEEVVELLNNNRLFRPENEENWRLPHGADDELGSGSELDSLPPDATRDRMPPDSAVPGGGR
ncbi:MAG TPA: phosphoribosyltransferase [Noviherbaspirillum sp.]